VELAEYVIVLKNNNYLVHAAQAILLSWKALSKVTTLYFSSYPCINEL